MQFSIGKDPLPTKLPYRPVGFVSQEPEDLGEAPGIGTRTVVLPTVDGVHTNTQSSAEFSRRELQVKTAFPDMISQGRQAPGIFDIWLHVGLFGD